MLLGKSMHFDTKFLWFCTFILELRRQSFLMIEILSLGTVENCIFHLNFSAISINARGHDLHYPAILRGKADKWKSTRERTIVDSDWSKRLRSTDLPWFSGLLTADNASRSTAYSAGVYDARSRVVLFFVSINTQTTHSFVCAVPHHNHWIFSSMTHLTWSVSFLTLTGANWLFPVTFQWIYKCDVIFFWVIS